MNISFRLNRSWVLGTIFGLAVLGGLGAIATRSFYLKWSPHPAYPLTNNTKGH
jgi:hypothetical protein